jgi:iron(III) transport system substrate-binding protein
MSTDPRRQPAWRRLQFLAVALVLAACSGVGAAPAATAPTASSAATNPTADTSGAAVGTITMYTTVTQSTVDAVVAAWKSADPGLDVEVFRAPTAEVAARIATDLQSGPIGADVLWLTDPLSIAAYEDQGLLAAWEPSNAAAIDPDYRTAATFGTRILNMVMVAGTGADAALGDWGDLTGTALKDAVAIPDPGFAGSAYAALAYLAGADRGIDYYRALKSAGAVQVKSPDEVTTGVAEGRFKAGMTLDNSVLSAAAKGSPVRMIWPTSGAIAIYSPIAVVAGSDARPTAESFVDFALSASGQAAIAATGWQPVSGPGGPVPQGKQVSPDWSNAFKTQKELLAAYRAIFGG